MNVYIVRPPYTEKLFGCARIIPRNAESTFYHNTGLIVDEVQEEIVRSGNTSPVSLESCNLDERWGNFATGVFAALFAGARMPIALIDNPILNTGPNELERIIEAPERALERVKRGEAPHNRYLQDNKYNIMLNAPARIIIATSKDINAYTRTFGVANVGLGEYFTLSKRGNHENHTV